MLRLPSSEWVTADPAPELDELAETLVDDRAWPPPDDLELVETPDGRL